MKDITKEQGKILDEILDERERQDKQWGGPEHDSEHVPQEWEDIILSHVQKLTQKGRTYRKVSGDYRQRLIKIAALTVAAIEAEDRK